MDKTNDYTNFSGRQYLKDYFLKNGKENKFLLKFLHESYLQIPKSKVLIEIGGGPTIYQLISAREKVDVMYFTDVAKSNFEEINWFKNCSKNAFDWGIFIKYVLELESKNAGKSSVNYCSHEIRKKIYGPSFADIRTKSPTLLVIKGSADILSMHSVPESVTNDEKNFIQCFKNALTLLRPGGYYVGMFVKNQPTFTCGGEKYQLFPVDESYLTRLFPKIGLKLLRMGTVEAENPNEEYEGLISVLCQKV